MGDLSLILNLERQLKEEKLRRLAEDAKGNLKLFFQEFAWPVLEPATPFVDNWHIDAVCEHLEAVSRGEIKRLIINMPFRMLKSTLVTQTFPVWEWLTRAHLQYLTASYAKDVATRDAVNSRRIIESDNFEMCYSNCFEMTGDQNVKTRYENNKRGQRVVTSTEGAGTGFGGNRIIVDDPINSQEANSEPQRLSSIEWYKGTAATRMNNPQEDAVILVHQRLHENDLTGHILREEAGAGWCHLILPMRYVKKHAVTTSIGFKDPRTKEGELLFPKRLNEDTVKTLEATLGTYHTAAQLQQRPNPRGGVVLNSDWFPRYTVLPTLRKLRIYGDTAQKTKEHNDYSVFELWGLGDNGKIYLIDLIRGKWEATLLLTKAVDFWNKHVERPEFSCALSAMKIEDKSSGTGLVQQIKKKGTIPVRGIPRHRDKLTRIYDGQPFMENGLVCLPAEAEWLSDYCSEIDAITKDDTHAHDDQLDPTLDAIDDLLGGKSSLYDNL